MSPICFFFFFDWHCNQLWVLASSVILFHSALSLHWFLHRLIPIIGTSPSISTIHLFLGLPVILIPIGFHSNIVLGVLMSSIRIMWPSQAILLLFINLTMSAFSVSSVCNSLWFSRIHLHFALGQRLFSILYTQVFWDVFCLDFSVSKLPIRRSLQALLNFCIFLTLSCCLMLLISLISLMHNSIGFHWEALFV